MAEARRSLVLVDGSGYIFRAFHALPELNNSRGLPVNAIYGFIRMLMKLLKDTRPTHIAVVFDAAKRTFRDDLFEDYKKNRVEVPNDLVKQIPYIHKAVDAFRILKIVREGFEADDVIGTLASRAAKQGIDTVIVTSTRTSSRSWVRISLCGTRWGQAHRSPRGQERFESNRGR